MSAGSRVFFAFVAATAAAAVVHAAAPAKKADGNKVICRVVQEIGSRLAEKRVCLTREQWQQQKEIERQNLDKIRIRTGPDGG
jgi:Spy/CpxP family protein refolding chaperone